MGQAMRLGDVIDNLPEFDSEETIYAWEPWTAESETIVAREPAHVGLPQEVLLARMKYFLEISIAKDLWETGVFVGWTTRRLDCLSARDRVCD